MREFNRNLINGFIPYHEGNLNENCGDILPQYAIKGGYSINIGSDDNSNNNFEIYKARIPVIYDENTNSWNTANTHIGFEIKCNIIACGRLDNHINAPLYSFMAKFTYNKGSDYNWKTEEIRVLSGSTNENSLVGVIDESTLTKGYFTVAIYLKNPPRSCDLNINFENIHFSNPYYANVENITTNEIVYHIPTATRNVNAKNDIVHVCRPTELNMMYYPTTIKFDVVDKTSSFTKAFYNDMLIEKYGVYLINLKLFFEKEIDQSASISLKLIRNGETSVIDTQKTIDGILHLNTVVPLFKNDQLKFDFSTTGNSKIYNYSVLSFIKL